MKKPKYPGELLTKMNRKKHKLMEIKPSPTPPSYLDKLKMRFPSLNKATTTPSTTKGVIKPAAKAVGKSVKSIPLKTPMSMPKATSTPMGLKMPDGFPASGHKRHKFGISPVPYIKNTVKSALSLGKGIANVPSAGAKAIKAAGPKIGGFRFNVRHKKHKYTLSTSGLLGRPRSPKFQSDALKTGNYHRDAQRFINSSKARGMKVTAEDTGELNAHYKKHKKGMKCKMKHKHTAAC